MRLSSINLYSSQIPQRLPKVEYLLGSLFPLPQHWEFAPPPPCRHPRTSNKTRHRHDLVPALGFLPLDQNAFPNAPNQVVSSPPLDFALLTFGYMNMQKLKKPCRGLKIFVRYQMAVGHSTPARSKHKPIAKNDHAKKYATE
mmetsp:Transcript_19118/g.34467  ORF Transcript_19118/g.34467 Transcript_19118/m.34467 type:complete len:142 (+) Transcript_19118:141-566(+)